MQVDPLVLITGATGNLGSKLRGHLEGRYPLILLDRESRAQDGISTADLAHAGAWMDLFRGVDTVFHFAADPTASQTWPALVGPNIDATLNVFEAARRHQVRRVVFASSNHVMGGYKDLASPERITTDLPPLPGTRYTVDEEPRDSSAYAATKLFGERAGRCLAVLHGIEFVAVRLGWNWRGENRPRDLPTNREDWYFRMWLSNRDFVHLMDRCLVAQLAEPFVIVNGMSANTGMRWDIEATRRLLDYQPRDDVARTM